MKLSRAESSALKAFAILCIMLHNYCHFMPWAVKENEYTFNLANPIKLWNRLIGCSDDLFVHWLSFFGHYGVPVFVFLSGYGLVMKYEKQDAPFVSFDRFARYNYLKLLRLMVLGFFAFILYWGCYNDTSRVFSLSRIVGHLTMTINLWETPNAVIKPGPYWYFGLTMQLYLLYRILLYRKRAEYVVLLMALCVLLQFDVQGNRDTLNWVRYNFMGNMLPFGMGILFARHGNLISMFRNGLLQKQWVMAVVAVLSFFLVFTSSFTFTAWTFAPVFVCIGSVSAVKALPQLTHKSLVFIGGISSAVFVLHPLFREIIIPVSKGGSMYSGLTLYVACSFFAAWIYTQILKLIPSPKL